MVRPQESSLRRRTTSWQSVSPVPAALRLSASLSDSLSDADHEDKNNNNHGWTLSVTRKNQPQQQHRRRSTSPLPTQSPLSRLLLRRTPLTMTVVAMAAAVVTTSIVAGITLGFPTAAHAAVGNLVEYGGGAATTVAAQTRTWFSSLMETGFYQAFSLVFLSEIGDKTFFIAGLLAMKTSRLISLIGSLAALGAMTLVSVIIGQVFHAVPSGIADGIPLDDIAAVAAFAFFGIKTLKEALFDGGSDSSMMDEELAEAEEAVEGSQTIKEVTPWGQLASIFALVFAAEFGDRSFLSTIALSAAQNPVSVAGGAIAAHALATGIAVSGGAVLAKYISERVIGIISGTLFLVFAVTTALGIF